MCLSGLFNTTTQRNAAMYAIALKSDFGRPQYVVRKVRGITRRTTKGKRKSMVMTTPFLGDGVKEFETVEAARAYAASAGLTSYAVVEVPAK
jgi:hypothetical protein